LPALVTNGSSFVVSESFDFKVETPNSTLILSVSHPGHLKKYAENLQTFHCYQQLHPNIVFWAVPSTHTAFDKDCGSVNQMFKRHCVVASILERNKGLIDLALHVDSDIAVVNLKAPSNFERFLPSGRDLALHNRFHNNEVTASSYLVRNTDFSRKFLREWASMYKFPANADNGALHALLLKRMGLETCPTQGDYTVFLLCFQRRVQQSKCQSDFFRKAVVWGLGDSWEYDGWVLMYAWNQNHSFMHHAMKVPPIKEKNGRLAPTLPCDGATTNHTDSYMLDTEAFRKKLHVRVNFTRGVLRKAGFPLRSCLWTRANSSIIPPP